MKTNVVQAAITYAELRWMLDDPAHIEELVADAESVQEAIRIIDQHADECELTDPFGPWVISPAAVDERKAKIKQLLEGENYAQL